MSKMYIDILVSLPQETIIKMLEKYEIITQLNDDYFGFHAEIEKLDEGFYEDEFPIKFNIFDYKTNISFWVSESDLKSLAIPWAYVWSKQISKKLDSKVAVFINSLEDLLWEFDSGVCLITNDEVIPNFSWKPS